MRSYLASIILAVVCAIITACGGGGGGSGDSGNNGTQTITPKTECKNKVVNGVVERDCKETEENHEVKWK